MPERLAGRVPAGERGRQRVASILVAAADVLIERGRVTMSAVAERAGISIGLLYQYFPNESAVLTALAEQHLAASRATLLNALDGPGEVVDQLVSALSDYLRVAEEQVAAAVMRSIQADARLAALDRADSARNALIAATALGQPELADDLALVIDLASVVALRAADLPGSARPALYETFLRMALSVLTFAETR